MAPQPAMTVLGKTVHRGEFSLSVAVMKLVVGVVPLSTILGVT